MVLNKQTVIYGVPVRLAKHEANQRTSAAENVCLLGAHLWKMPGMESTEGVCLFGVKVRLILLHVS